MATGRSLRIVSSDSDPFRSLQGFYVAVVGQKAEADGDDIHRSVRLQKCRHLRRSNPAGPVHGKSIRSRTDGRKGDALQVVLPRQVKAAPVAAGQQFVLADVPALPDGAHGMNDVACRQPVSFGDARLARRAAADAAALLQKLGTRSLVNGSVHASTAQKRVVGGIDYGIDLQGCDVCQHEVDCAVQFR